jgi:plasmid stability protein
MAVNITLKNIPDKLYKQLKRSADANHRSINGEAIACLSKALQPQVGITPELIDDIRRFSDGLKPFSLETDEVRAAINKGRP